MRIRYIFLFLVFLFSCKGKTSKSDINVNLDGLFVEHDLVKYKKIILIPGSGCTGCISDAENYFVSNHGKTEYLYVFYNIGDSKIFSLKFPDSLVVRGNVFVDKTNKIGELNASMIYPTMAELREGKVFGNWQLFSATPVGDNYLRSHN